MDSAQVVAALGALAQDTRLDRKVALKILPDDVAGDPDRMRRFVQEAKAASASMSGPRTKKSTIAAAPAFCST